MDNEKFSDEHIIRRVLNGDIDIFEHIVNRYKSFIFNIGIRFFKNADDANDFVQEVFIRIYNNLKSYKGSAPFRFWLGRVAYNLAVNTVKSKKVDTEFNEDYQSDEISPEQSHIKNEVKEMLLDAIQELPENHRICLDFYFFHGLSYSEINALTGFPVNTIKSYVFRAKQSLRDALRGSIAEEYHEM